MLELKHAAHHDALGLPLDVPLLRDAARHGLDHPWARVTLMSFETPILRRLAERTRLPIVQLLDARRTHVTPEELARIDEYADGHRPAQVAGAAPRRTTARSARRRPWSATPTGSADRPRLDGARGEPLPAHQPAPRDGPRRLGDMAGEVRALLDAGVDGVITDHPEEALSVVREQAATAVG